MTKQTDYHPLCNDCGVDVLQSGDWYMTPPELWAGRSTLAGMTIFVSLFGKTAGT